MGGRRRRGGPGTGLPVRERREGKRGGDTAGGRAPSPEPGRAAAGPGWASRAAALDSGPPSGAHSDTRLSTAILPSAAAACQTRSGARRGPDGSLPPFTKEERAGPGRSRLGAAEAAARKTRSGSAEPSPADRRGAARRNRGRGAGGAGAAGGGTTLAGPPGSGRGSGDAAALGAASLTFRTPLGAAGARGRSPPLRESEEGARLRRSPAALGARRGGGPWVNEAPLPCP